MEMLTFGLSWTAIQRTMVVHSIARQRVLSFLFCVMCLPMRACCVLNARQLKSLLEYHQCVSQMRACCGLNARLFDVRAKCAHGVCKMHFTFLPMCTPNVCMLWANARMLDVCAKFTHVVC